MKRNCEKWGPLFNSWQTPKIITSISSSCTLSKISLLRMNASFWHDHLVLNEGKKYLYISYVSKVQINFMKSCKLKTYFFYCIKIYLCLDALLYQTHLSPTNAAANNSQMWHSMPVYLFDIKHSTVCCCTYNTGCSIQIWLFWHDNKYLGIALRGGGGGSYGHSNCCCSSSYLLHYALWNQKKYLTF